MKKTMRILVVFAVVFMASSLMMGVISTVSEAKLKYEKKIYKKNYKTEDGIVYFKHSVEYPHIKGNSVAAKRINNYYKSLLNKDIKDAERSKESAEAAFEMSERKYKGKQYYKFAKGYPANSSKYFSLVLWGDYADSVGNGAKGYEERAVFDVKTGKPASAEKIMGLSKKQINKRVRKSFEKSYLKSHTGYNYSDDDYAEFKKTLKKINFTKKGRYVVKKNKAVFFLEAYEPYHSTLGWSVSLPMR